MWWAWASQSPCLSFMFFILNHELVRSVSKIPLISIFCEPMLSIQLDPKGLLEQSSSYTPVLESDCVSLRLVTEGDRNKSQSSWALHMSHYCCIQTCSTLPIFQHIFLFSLMSVFLILYYGFLYSCWLLQPAFAIWFWFEMLCGKVTTSILCLTL